MGEYIIAWLCCGMINGFVCGYIGLQGRWTLAFALLLGPIATAYHLGDGVHRLLHPELR